MPNVHVQTRRPRGTFDRWVDDLVGASDAVFYGVALSYLAVLFSIFCLFVSGVWRFVAGHLQFAMDGSFIATAAVSALYISVPIAAALTVLAAIILKADQRSYQKQQRAMRQVSLPK